MRFDSDGIDAVTKITKQPSALAALRAETVKAALNKAITARANAVITKYGNIEGILKIYKEILPKKGQRINELVGFVVEEAQKLREAYNWGYPVPAHGGIPAQTLPPRPAVVAHSTITSDLDSRFFKVTEPGGAEKLDSRSRATESQIMVGYEYKAPAYENTEREKRALISLGDESISHFMQSHYLERMEEVLKNELASIDTDINQLQVAYLNTILLSPIDGIVTGVYKNPGDSVGAGEPVFRVENNSEVLIIANVVCRGPIAIGSVLEVKTQLFDSPDSARSIKADIVAARGQGANDQWEVIAKRSNLDDGGNSIFPLGYHFDYDNTEVAILD